jgi:hypothetical protein
MNANETAGTERRDHGGPQPTTHRRSVGSSSWQHGRLILSIRVYQRAYGPDGGHVWRNLDKLGIPNTKMEDCLRSPSNRKALDMGKFVAAPFFGTHSKCSLGC